MNQWTPPSIAVRITPDTSTQIVTALSRLDMLQDVKKKLTNDEQYWQLAQLDTESPDTKVGTLGLIRHDGVQLAISFTSGKVLHRLNESSHGAQQLNKALGINAAIRRIRQTSRTIENIHIVDATGGLGQDTWAIASLGCKVTVFESHPIIHALLDNALQRAAEHELCAAIAARITLVHGDACAALKHHTNTLQAQRRYTSSLSTHLPEVHAIYLDPMYPQRRKSANTKKGMQFLHSLLGPPDARQQVQLLLEALECGAGRVVVKRPKGAPEIDRNDPWHGQRTQLNFPNTRYDIYHPRQRN